MCREAGEDMPEKVIFELDIGGYVKFHQARRVEESIPVLIELSIPLKFVLNS